MPSLNVNRAEFVKSAADPRQFIRSSVPTVAFAGKSNVGKSSVINRLLNRKNFARVGASPGKTVHVNYFLIDEKLYFVDLPGYGYAKVSEAEKARWGKMIEKYLHTSKQLRQVFLLVDIRHAPGANDRQMYEWITANGYEPVIIATKLDKLNRSERQKAEKILRTGLGISAETKIFPYSATTQEGREAIYTYLEELL